MRVTKQLIPGSIFCLCKLVKKPLPEKKHGRHLEKKNLSKNNSLAYSLHRWGSSPISSSEATVTGQSVCASA